MDNNKVISTYTKILTSKSENTAADAISFLCEHFDFDCAAIYEINQSNQFQLKQLHNLGKKEICRSFGLNEIKKVYQEIKIQEEGLYFFDAYNGDEIEKEICEFLETGYAVVCPVVDKMSQILGILILMRERRSQPTVQKHFETLKSLLSLTEMYVSKSMYENKISFAVSSLESIMDHTGIDIYVNDFDNHDILYANQSMAAPYGGIQAFMNKKCYEVLYPGQKEPCVYCPQKKIVDEEGNPTKTYTWDYQRPSDGNWYRVFSSAFRWVDGRIAHVVSSADITDNKKQEALIHHMANYDELTNLPNRRMLVRDCEQIINKSSKEEKGYVLFFDIDGFKAINDDYGHDAGDEFLIQLGEFFSQKDILKDCIYRNGGDEFVAIIGGERKSEQDIVDLITKIQDRFKKPWILKKGNVYCTTSVGVAKYPEDGKNAEKLLSIADQSMYMIKKNGGAGMCFSCKKK